MYNAIYTTLEAYNTYSTHIYVVQMSLICTSHDKTNGQWWKPQKPKCLSDLKFD